MDLCPERGRTCLENGSYLLNYKGCGGCGQRDFIKIIDREVTRNDDETEEEVTFTHVCSLCEHVIATHEYSFSVDDQDQQYSMNCMLCGFGEDTCSFMPDDPRKVCFPSSFPFLCRTSPHNRCHKCCTERTP